MRVAVIGTGIVGACVAWNLTQRGADVLMVDAGRPGAGVTNWSFSWVNASNKTQTREYFDLNVAGMSAYRDLVGNLGGSEWCHLTGHLRWFDTPERSEQLRDEVTRLGDWGYAATVWTADRARRLLEPHVRFPADDTVVGVYPDEGWISGRALVARLTADAADRGAKAFFDAPATDIVVDHGRVRGIVLSGNDRHAVDAVVNAAGPAAGRIAGLVQRDLPMRDEPGLVIRLLCDEVPVQRAMHTPHVEIRPDGENRVLLHSRAIDDSIDADPDSGSGSGSGSEGNALSVELLALARDVVPALTRAEVAAQMVVWRPIPADGFPSVGGVEGVSGYYEAVTHSGITLGAVLGRLLAAEIIDGTVDPLIAPYRPDRFAGDRS